MHAQPAPAATHGTKGIKFDLLFLMLVVGSLGAPLIGPLRERMQTVLSISRAALGFGIFSMGLAAGVLAFVFVQSFTSIRRTAYIRTGTLLMTGGMLVMWLVAPAPGWKAAALAGGWFLMLFGGTFGGMSNATVMDLWHESPGAGVILLHGTNALGKVLAPLLVFFVGSSLGPNAFIYTALLALLVVRMSAWPRPMVKELNDHEGELHAAAAGRGTGVKSALFWAASLQFFFIAGSEAGVVSILGSFVTVLRPAPFAGMGQHTWAALVLIIMQSGIVAGRFAFVGLSQRGMAPRRIITLCMAFAMFMVPGVLATHPAAYTVSLFLAGIAFSATWPAYFALAGARFPEARSSFAVSSGLFNVLGINGCILLTSVIGNSDARLPAAILVSTALLSGLGIFLYVTPAGKKL